jgi:hypothetical protein
MMYSVSNIYLHFMDPDMARKPVGIEIVHDNKTNHINYIITLIIRSPSQLHILSETITVSH